MRKASIYKIHPLLIWTVAGLLWGIFFLTQQKVNTAFTASTVIFEVDNTTQTNRVTTYGVYFKQGEIAGCAVPIIGGSQLDASHYQCDAKTRWPDGSLQRAVMSIIHTESSGGSTTVTYTSGACNNAGYLTQSQMYHFNSDGWGATIVASTGGVPQTVDARAMVNALSVAYCQLEYYLQGPIVTGVRVQNCLSSFDYDFGGRYGGPVATVSISAGANGGSGCTTGNTVTFDSALGTGAVITPVVAGGVITGYTVTSGGLGYWGGGINVAKGTCASTPLAAFTTGANVMNLNSGAWYTGTSTYASLHPVFDLLFIPSKNIVQVEFQVQDEWTSRGQNQFLDSLSFKTGATPTEVWNLTSLYPSGYEIPFRTNIRKLFYSGTAPGHVRIDPNFSYLIEAGLLPPYDRTSTVTSTVPAGILSGPYGVSYTTYAGGSTGDVGNTGGLNQQFSDNVEIAPQQIETLRWFYEAADGQSVASARAYAVLTGEVDTVNGLVGVPGGGGLWNVYSNIPLHWRESRPSNAEPGYTANNYYCSGFASKDYKQGDACGTGTGAYLGRGFSRHAWALDRISPTNKFPGAQYGRVEVGYYDTAGWSIEDCSHMQEYSFLAAVVTGRQYYVDEMNAVTDTCIAAHEDPNGFTNNYSGDPSIRSFGANLQMATSAMVINPDGSPEKLYYTQAAKRSLGAMEGFLNITGTALTPTLTTCSGYSLTNANSWQIGRCQSGNDHAVPLHMMTLGGCLDGDAYATIDPATASFFVEDYFQWEAQILLSYVYGLGLTDTTATLTEISKRLIEATQDPTYVPFLVGYELSGNAYRASACSGLPSNSETFTTWGQVKLGFLSQFQNPNSMGSCDGKDYALLAKAASSNSTTNSSGPYTGLGAYNWVTANFPQYFSGACTAAYHDQQLRYAILPPVAPAGQGGSTLRGKAGLRGKGTIK